MRRFPLVLLAGVAWSQAKVDFVRDVVPLLQKRCVACHGSAVESGGLRLDRRPGESALGKMVGLVSGRGKLRMPPVGDALTGAEVAVLAKWIDQGAPWTAELRHWAFVAPRKAQPPYKAAHPIDAFIQARLAAEGLVPSPEADRHTLIRRAWLDLVGLPPTPSDVDAFLADARPDAFERVVDRLLESPHFGEKWARPWLDLARYADSDGYETDQLRPHAWRYRHWVVEALNRNLPYDRFTIEQIAGDLLPGAGVDQRVATGFHRNTLSNREGGADLEEYRVEQVVDRVATVGTTWLGLTVGCARCHDHKYDPISQREFYQLYAVFNSADEVNIPAPLAGEWGEYLREWPGFQKKWREIVGIDLETQLAPAMADWERKVIDAEANPGRDHLWDRQLELIGLIWEGNLGGGQLEGLYILKTPRAGRTPSQQQRLFEYFLRRGELVDRERFQALGVREVVKKLDALNKTAPPLTLAPTMFENPLPKPNFIHARGDFRSRGAEVQRGTPAVLPPSAAPDRLNRLEFAKWLVSRNNPLTARVAVNRIWQELFGVGLVSTSEDFGAQGAKPSHPELLDWLAVEFMDRAWDIKKMVKTVMMSHTYRQASHATPAVQAKDPGNRLLARQSRLRLPAELIRDSGLAVSGLLNPKVGGPSVRPPQPEAVTKEAFETPWVPSPGADRYRRGLYTWLQRTAPFAQSVTFDAPDPTRACSRRERSNTPLQALTLLNDPVFVEMAQALAERVLREQPGSMADRLDYAFRLCVGRAAKAVERDRLLEYLNRQRAQLAIERDSTFFAFRVDGMPQEETAAWAGLASILLNLDEFITRE